MAAHPILDRAIKMLLLAGTTGLLLGTFALPATALDTVSPSAVLAPAGDACPELTAIKYPWLACRENEFGGVSLVLPSQPAPLACHLLMPNGECAASGTEWGIGPMIPPSAN
jgi:hypothetical protein